MRLTRGTACPSKGDSKRSKFLDIRRSEFNGDLYVSTLPYVPYVVPRIRILLRIPHKCMEGHILGNCGLLEGHPGDLLANENIT